MKFADFTEVLERYSLEKKDYFDHKGKLYRNEYCIPDTRGYFASIDFWRGKYCNCLGIKQ